MRAEDVRTGDDIATSHDYVENFYRFEVIGVTK